MSSTVHLRSVQGARRVAVGGMALRPGLGLVLAFGLSLGACSTRAIHNKSINAGEVATTSSMTAGAVAPIRIGTYRVVSTRFDVTEPGATPAAPSRKLPTVVWYPAGQAHGILAANAGGTFPLLVFSQGYDLSVSAYEGLLEDWASAGFVVAAPTYPHTDPSEPASLDESDIVNHPADLRSVLTTVLGMAEERGSALFGLVDPNEIGVAGHSDGGDVSLAVGADSCCRDPRVKAVAILSGAELASFGGRYFSGGNLPLLIVQGSIDTINPPPCSVQIYDAAGPPKYYLDLMGAGHEPPYVDPGTIDQQIVAKVTTDFFEAQLAGRTGSAAAIIADGNVPGIGHVSKDGTGHFFSGGCPGAPG